MTVKQDYLVDGHQIFASSPEEAEQEYRALYGKDPDKVTLLLHCNTEEEYETHRTVTVRWSDLSETPTQAIERLNKEVLEYSAKAAEIQAEFAEYKRKVANLLSQTAEDLQ